jgi:hypothetical protein
VGAAGEAIRMWAPEAVADAIFATEVQPGWASFPKSHTEQPYTTVVSITTPTNNTERRLPLVVATYPKIQTLMGGDILVVAPRCQHFTDGTHEMNARIYQPDGSMRCEFCLGDGIEDVQVARDGRIWVGYFDEGIFGNFGWGNTGGAAPLGVAGLVCYDSRGSKLWEFEAPSGFEPIASCYALNVAHDAVWVCYYTEFPIMRVDSQLSVRAWNTTLSGQRELAVSGESVLVYGGYSENRTDCKLLRLRNGLAEQVAQVKLRLPNHVELDRSTVVGRDRVLHVFTGDEWYMFSPEG